MPPVPRYLRWSPDGSQTTDASGHGAVDLSRWLHVWQINDFVHNAPSDSGFYGRVMCPKCSNGHLATISKIGWFLYECQGAVITGHMPNWRTESVVLIRKGGDN